VLLLHGPTSVGKTHLLRAILRHAQQERLSTVVSSVAGMDVVDRLVTALRHGPGGADSLGWKGAEFIALDDLHVLAERPRTQHELARVLRESVAAGSRVICAAGGSLRPLETLVAGLAQSPGMAATALDRPSARELGRILTGLADRRTLMPGPSGRRAIAAASKGDVRRAMGALTSWRFGHSLHLAG
jgi:chromosomal replication initiation ATPase DnaA